MRQAAQRQCSQLDGTLVPASFLKEAGFRSSRLRRNLVLGDLKVAESVVGYEVFIRINSLEFREVDVFASLELNDVILGRNILNQLVFTYDGPRRLLEILTP